jgi:WD40 repeat protein
MPNGRHALTWSSDATFRLWDLDSGAARAFEGHNGPITGALLIPDGRHALSWADDHTLRLWDLDSGMARSFTGHCSSVTGALLMPDGSHALSWSDATLRLWDLNSGTARTFVGHGGSIWGVLLLPDGRRAVRDGISSALECREHRDGCTAVLATTLAMAPRQPFRLAGGYKAHCATDAATLKLIAHHKGPYSAATAFCASGLSSRNRGSTSFANSVMFATVSLWSRKPPCPNISKLPKPPTLSLSTLI